jgi:hypothetical protein
MMPSIWEAAGRTAAFHQRQDDVLMRPSGFALLLAFKAANEDFICFNGLPICRPEAQGHQCAELRASGAS